MNGNLLIVSLKKDSVRQTVNYLDLPSAFKRIDDLIDFIRRQPEHYGLIVRELYRIKAYAILEFRRHEHHALIEYRSLMARAKQRHLPR